MSLEPPRALAPAERAIVIYKATKGAIELALASGLFVVVLGGWVQGLQSLVRILSEHATRAWSMSAAQALLRTLTPRHVAITAVALLLDGVLTSFEGWAVRRGRSWGRWLVVLATGSLLPFEIVAFARNRRWIDVVSFVVNVAIVVYLARRALTNAAIASSDRSG